MVDTGLGYYTPGFKATPKPLTGNERFPLDTALASGQSPQTAYVTSSELATYMGGGLPLVTGRFYGLPRGVTPVAVLTVASTIYAYPIYIANEVTVASLNVGVTTGQTGGACHLAIYADNGEGYPGERVYESGAVAGLTSTTVVTKSSVATTLNAGWYWIASIFTATTTLPSVTGITANYGSETNAQLGNANAADALAVSAKAVSGISVAGTYGTLPATFTSGGTLTVNAATPLIVLGV